MYNMTTLTLRYKASRSSGPILLETLTDLKEQTPLCLDVLEKQE